VTVKLNDVQYTQYIRNERQTVNSNTEVYQLLGDLLTTLHFIMYSVSKKIPPLKFSDIFSHTVGNF